jgi:UrcA family protein
MKTSSASLSRNIAPGSLALAAAAAALALWSARAHAADLDQITLSAPIVKDLQPNDISGAPEQETIVNARVQYDPATLTTLSGVALLKASVEEAARKACQRAGFDPTYDDDSCYRGAVDSAQPQIDAAIARAKNSSSKT